MAPMHCWDMRDPRYYAVGANSPFHYFIRSNTNALIQIKFPWQDSLTSSRRVCTVSPFDVGLFYRSGSVFPPVRIFNESSHVDWSDINSCWICGSCSVKRSEAD
ncbi:hypothetical protein Ancab_002780 [Ancistrocladus abbreviatus]